jgi:hypothetical protein
MWGHRLTYAKHTQMIIPWIQWRQGPSIIFYWHWALGPGHYHEPPPLSARIDNERRRRIGVCRRGELMVAPVGRGCSSRPAAGKAGDWAARSPAVGRQGKDAWRERNRGRYKVWRSRVGRQVMGPLCPISGVSFFFFVVGNFRVN